MTDRTIEDIRRLLDPDGYRAQLVNAKAALKERLAGLFVDRDLIETNPELSEATKKMAMENADKQIHDMDWRLQEVDRLIANCDKKKGEAVGAKTPAEATEKEDPATD